MTSDFDNDEIIDSAFPVDFNDVTNSLDMYGVWVKNAPRDADAEPVQDDQADIPAPSGFAGLDTYEDISSLPDLPDFDETESEVTPEESDIRAEIGSFDEDITWDEENAEGEDSIDLTAAEDVAPAEESTESAGLPDFDLSPLEEQEIPVFDDTLPSEENAFDEAEISVEEPVETTTFDLDMNDTEPVDFPDFGEINFEENAPEESPTDESVNVNAIGEESDASVHLSSSPLSGTEPLTEEAEIVFEDEAVEIERPEIDDAAVKPSPAINRFAAADSVETEEISLDAFDTDESPDEEIEVPEISEETVRSIEFEELTDGEEISVQAESDDTEDLANAIEASFDAVPMETEESSSIAYDESEETDSLPAETFAIDASLPSDDDFSGFLDELNASGPAGIKSDGGLPAGEDLDLDSFIDQFNETGGRSDEETEQMFDDSAPVDLDLDFDEDFIADAQMIKETGSSVSESEFMSSEFGVEMIDETPSVPSGEIDDFNALFSAAEDISAQGQSAPAGAAESLGLVETDEFDDLLSSLDASPAPVQAPKDTVKPKAAPQVFDLSVSEEDGAGPIAAPVNDSSGEDEDVSLFEDTHRSESATVDNETESGPTEQEPEAAVEFTDEPLITEENLVEENLVIEGITDYNDIAQFPDTEDFATAAEGDSVSADFDDISAVEKELSDMAPETGDIELNASDKSTELLMLIADELSSIKQELSNLKSELAGIKSVQPVGPEEKIDEPQDSGGFFSDDDHDEAIALTGDELNNILITADFTEEKNVYGEESAEPAVTERADDAGDQKNAEDYEVPDTLPDSIFDIPTLNETAEIQVGHVNTVEDDLSYLEESDFSESDMDNVAIDESDIEVIDFNDEKLEEPELTEFNIDLDEIGVGFPAEQEIAKDGIEEPSAEESLPEADTEIDDSIQEEDLSIPEEPVTEEAPLIEVSLEPNDDEGFDIPEFKDTDETSEPFEVPEETSTDTEMAETEATGVQSLPIELKDEIKSVLSYMDQLLESLPENKIEEFARSEHFNVYKKLFEELGIS